MTIEKATQSLRDEWMTKFMESTFYDDLMRLTQTPEELAEVIVGTKYMRIAYKGKEVAVKPLRFGENTIGRDDTCDIVLSDPKVSRSHCSLTVNDNDQVIVSDLGSSRGTYVNSAKIMKFGLKVGDRVKVGETRLTLSKTKK